MGYIELNVLNNTDSPLAMGIDLGTTNSLAAVWKDGRPRIIKPEGSSAEGGSGKIPSVIRLTRTGQSVVGRKALDQAVVDPRHTIFSIKRFMGRGLADVQADLADFPFPVREDENGLLKVDGTEEFAIYAAVIGKIK